MPPKEFRNQYGRVGSTPGRVIRFKESLSPLDVPSGMRMVDTALVGVTNFTSTKNDLYAVTLQVTVRMSLSSRFAIAVHSLSLLALYRDKEVTSSFMSESIKTNPVVVRKVLANLRTAGLIKTREGAGGGYSLAKGPQKISLDLVYAAVEAGPLFSPHLSTPDHHCPVGAGIEKVLERVNEDAEQGLMATLSKLTVADVLERTLAVKRIPA